MKKSLAIVMMLISCGAVWSQEQIMTLERCRREAVENNVLLKAAQERIAIAQALEGVALSQFFPKLDANAAISWNSKSVQLLSDQQQDDVNHIGTRVTNDISNSLSEIISEIGLTDPTLASRLVYALGGMRLEENLNGMGQQVTDAMNINLSHLAVGMVSVRQPVFLGGRLVAAYKTAKLNTELQQLTSDKVFDDLLVAVNKAYWEYISLKHKEQLAQEYYNLLQKLSQDVDVMVQTEVATQREVTQVRVKLNEARMNLTKASGGVAVAQLALCQLCGLDLTGNYTFIEDTLDLDKYSLQSSTPAYNVEQSISQRSDVAIAQTLEGMMSQGVTLARAGLLPNVAVAGGYITTRPNFFNGYQDNFDGMFSAGVAVNIPICHPGDIYALRAAKHKAVEASYEVEEVRKLARLEISTCTYQLDVAVRKMQQSTSDLENAEENLRLANESFEAGVITSTDLMMAQTAWLKAKTELLDAQIDIRMKNLMLLRALGK